MTEIVTKTSFALNQSLSEIMNCILQNILWQYELTPNTLQKTLLKNIDNFYLIVHYISEGLECLFFERLFV